MTKDDPEERPNCQDIINEKQFWALSENEFNFKKEIRSILKRESNEDCNINSILEAKLDNFLKEENMVEIMKHYVKMQGRFVDMTTFNSSYKENENGELSNGYCFLIMQKIFILNHDDKVAKFLSIKSLEEAMENYFKAMKSYPNNEQIQKYSLVMCAAYLNTMQQIKISSTTKIRCSKVIFDVLLDFKSTDVNLAALYIISNFSNKISLEEKISLCANNAYFEAILKIAKNRIDLPPTYDDFLNLSIFILCNLTETIPETCENFVQASGIDLCIHIFEVRFYKKL
jgi:hypothetical protein